MIGDYVADRAFRRKFQAWLNDLWTQKDQRITALLDATRTADSGMRAHPGAEAPHTEELQSDSRKAVQSMP